MEEIPTIPGVYESWGLWSGIVTVCTGTVAKFGSGAHSRAFFTLNSFSREKLGSYERWLRLLREVSLLCCSSWDTSFLSVPVSGAPPVSGSPSTSPAWRDNNRQIVGGYTNVFWGRRNGQYQVRRWVIVIGVATAVVNRRSYDTINNQTSLAMITLPVWEKNMAYASPSVTCHVKMHQYLILPFHSKHFCVKSIESNFPPLKLTIPSWLSIFRPIRSHFNSTIKKYSRFDSTVFFVKTGVKQAWH